MSDIPRDLDEAGFRLVVRAPTMAADLGTTPRYLLISQCHGVAVGATLEDAIREARSVLRFTRYIDRQGGSHG